MTDAAGTVQHPIVAAIERGDRAEVRRLLDENPPLLQFRNPPYEWTLLHSAAAKGHLAIVELLLERGLDVNAREAGDNTVALHWAAAAGHVDVVKRLVEAGSDVIGAGDDHGLEIIGWATCWEGCDDDAHRAVADLLVRRGARHHIFSAIAVRDADLVRAIVAAEPAALNRRMSRNENHQSPLQFAVRMRRPAMVELLLSLGADPLVVDGDGMPAAAYAQSIEDDRAVMRAVLELTRAELLSAARGHRAPRAGTLDLVAALSLGEMEIASRLVAADRALLDHGALHLTSKRGDAASVAWLLERGANPDAMWAHWDADVTALHLAAWRGHEPVVRALLAAGANTTIRDSKHESDAIGWALFFGQAGVEQLLAKKP